jgi:hypothetical protein
MMFFVRVGLCFGTTLVCENFDDKQYASPLTFFNGTAYNANIVYNSANAYMGSGYCLQWDHSKDTTGIGVLSDLTKYLANGIYFRYWVKYDTNYLFPAETGEFENLKMFKVAGSTGYDIEFIYKQTLGGPSQLQLYWSTASGGVGGTGVNSVSTGDQLTKGKWHKIEIYLKVNTTSIVHVQIDDHDVYQNTNANIPTPASAYASTNQFMSVRVRSEAPSGHGTWYTDNITIVTNEGDLCNKEPAEPSSSGSTGTPPAVPTISGITTQ